MSRRQQARVTRREARAARQRAWHMARIAETANPSHRMTVALNYVLACLTRTRASEPDRVRVATTVSDELVRLGDQIREGNIP